MVCARIQIMREEPFVDPPNEYIKDVRLLPQYPYGTKLGTKKIEQ